MARIAYLECFEKWEPELRNPHARGRKQENRTKNRNSIKRKMHVELQLEDDCSWN